MNSRYEGFFVFAVNRGSGADELSTESRMFCPALGIPEDPASGNAHAMLASYLFEIGQFGKQSTGFVGYQGRQMKRPARDPRQARDGPGEPRGRAHRRRAVIVSEGRWHFKKIRHHDAKTPKRHGAKATGFQRTFDGPRPSNGGSTWPSSRPAPADPPSG